MRYHKLKNYRNKIITPPTETNAPINSIGAILLPLKKAGTMSKIGVNAINAEAIPVSVLVSAYKDNPTPRLGPKKDPIVICFIVVISLNTLLKVDHLLRTAIRMVKHIKPVIIRI